MILSEIPELQQQAEAALGQGLSHMEEPHRAEQYFLKALRIYDRLWSLMEDRKFSQAAGQVCQYLAEICMQQGNMHGADVYYVKAMACAQEKSPGKHCQSDSI